jgi:hypothetical protein
MHLNPEAAMQILPLLVPTHQFRIGLQSFLAGRFPGATKHQDARDLPDYLKRDIGLGEGPLPIGNDC